MNTVMSFKRRWAALALLAVPVLAPVTAAAQTPWGKDYFPNISLTTEAGKKVKFYDDVLKGKILVVNFIFTKCGDVCPLDTAQLKKVSEILGDKMGKSIFFYSISVDPKNDTPAALTEFKKKCQIGKGWTFLTGIGGRHHADPEEIRVGACRRHADRAFDDHPAGERSHGSVDQAVAVRKSADAGEPAGWASQCQRHAYVPRLARSRATPRLFQCRMAAMASSFIGHDARAATRSAAATELGPDLMMATGKHADAWMKRWLREPDKMIAEGDAYATAQMKQFRNLAMPDLKLDDHAIDLLIAFMDKESVTAMEGKAAADHNHHKH